MHFSQSLTWKPRYRSAAGGLERHRHRPAREEAEALERIQNAAGIGVGDGRILSFEF